MLCSHGEFVAMAETRSYRLITHFFDKLDKRDFLKALRLFLQKVDRACEAIKDHASYRAAQLAVLNHLIAPESPYSSSLHPNLSLLIAPRKRSKSCSCDTCTLTTAKNLTMRHD